MAHHPDSTIKTSLAETNNPKQQREFDEGKEYLQLTASVERPMNSHGALRLSTADGHRTFQVVDYATDELRRAMNDITCGTTLEVRLVKLGSRGSAWRVVALESVDQTQSNPELRLL